MENKPIKFQEELNEEQKKVVLDGDGPCLVLAGAGSGKTRVIIYRVANLLEKGIQPENILLLTFTNKASKEMLSRVDALIQRRGLGDEVSRRIMGGTFHRVANLILRKYAPMLGYESNFTILDEDDAKSFMSFAVKETGVDNSSKRYPSSAVIKEIWSFSRNSMQSLETTVGDKYQNFYQYMDMIRNAVNIYENKKRKSNSMDFDDLLLNLLNLIRTRPEIRDILSDRFQYVLVDEYQDTNKIQAEMIYHLCYKHKNILAVGDDAQSIYSFRAAEIRNILDFPKHFPGAKIFKLETNYRSTPDILDFANSVISFNTNQFPKNLMSLREGLEKPKLVPAVSTEEEADYITNEIMQLNDEGIALRDIAVLFRASHNSQSLEMELVKRGIPYDYRGGMRFFERAHIKDVISYLRIAQNVRDDAAWMRILEKQRGIGKETANKVLEKISNCENLSDVVNANLENKLSGRAQIGWHDFIKIASAMVEAKTKGVNVVASLISAILLAGYQVYLESEYADAGERIDDLDNLALYAKKYDSLEAFLAEASLSENFGLRHETDGGDREKIVLSTIHQAKGLEWRAVFIINLTDNTLPHRRAILEDGGEEEERRLFYVAITRAKDHLYLTYPITGGRDSVYLESPSRFINDIPGHLLERTNLSRGEVLPVIEI
jgi:DNA helicase-2/ATP-dependent DNA helicase PcrA